MRDTSSFLIWVLIIQLSKVLLQRFLVREASVYSCWFKPDSVVETKISGENLMHQSVSLLRVKDPLFKRMGASRLARFAKDGNLNYLYFSSQITWYQHFNYL
jgi:hypothetical protein